MSRYVDLSRAADGGRRTRLRLLAVPQDRRLHLWSLLILVAAAGCGDGGATEPRAAATLVAPSFESARGDTLVVELGLVTNRPAAGLQADLTALPEVIRVVTGVESAGRASALQGADVQNLVPGRSRLLLFDARGETIPTGEGPVLALTVAVNSLAPSGVFPIGIENALVVDSTGGRFDLDVEPGQVTVQP